MLINQYITAVETLCQNGVSPCYDIQACVLSCLTCVQLFVTLWTEAHQAPLSMGSSRQEYWRGRLCPPPGDLPNPGIKPTSLMFPALVSRFFTASATWEAHIMMQWSVKAKRISRYPPNILHQNSCGSKRYPDVCPFPLDLSFCVEQYLTVID